MKNFLKTLLAATLTLIASLFFMLIIVLAFGVFDVVISDFMCGWLAASFFCWQYENIMHRIFKTVNHEATDTRVISAFPGTGKSHMYRKHKLDSKISIKDSDSSTFDKADFPDNYIRHIKSMLCTVDIIFVSSHDNVREALAKNKIQYTLIYPELSCKSEYIARYKQRNSPQAFIDLIDKNWETFIRSCMKQKNCEHIVLKEGQYISDVI